ncbi:uncharacterized protein LOC114256458 [Camellia sinensis]|uniref:uncharacterized protein LOC114256458 n=1 Tax=Camellia sinensis TaxID=4442 RepID=UPI00103586F1|nr:uncharacterized protein LOC114256458 [Camellia sinensis]
MVEFLADHPVEGDVIVEYLFPDKDILQVEEETWMMYFDGASNQYGYRIGVLLMAPDDSHIPLAIKVRFKVSNNKAEHEACIASLEATLELRTIGLDVIGDSNLNNRFTDALAILSSMVDIPLGVKIRSVIIEQKYMPTYETIAIIDEVQDKNPWYYDIWNFLEKETYPLRPNAKDKRGIQRLAIQFIISRNKLYKRGHLEMHKLCVEEEESNRLMEAIHGGECGAHMNSVMLAMP